MGVNAQEFYDLKGPEATEAVCRKAETPFSHFIACMQGKRTFGKNLAARLEIASEGEMDRVSLLFGSNPPPPPEVTLAADAVLQEGRRLKKVDRAT